MRGGGPSQREIVKPSRRKNYYNFFTTPPILLSKRRTSVRQLLSRVKVEGARERNDVYLDSGWFVQVHPELIIGKHKQPEIGA